MKRYRVLVVDDEPGIRESLSGVLEDEGYEVESVGDGEACLLRLAERPFDAVLLDVWLPGMDGMETLMRIQEIPQPGSSDGCDDLRSWHDRDRCSRDQLGAYDSWRNR